MCGRLFKSALQPKLAGNRKGTVNMSKPKKLDFDNLTPEEVLKLEIAEEIGVLDKVVSGGFRCLSAKESGKIGGIISRRKKEAQKKMAEEGKIV